MKTGKKWNLFRQAPGRITGIVAGNLAANVPRGMFNILLYLVVIQLVIPVLQGTPHDFTLLWRYALYYAAAFLLYLGASAWSQTNSFVQSYIVSSEIRLDLADKLRSLSLGFFKQHDPGDVTSRLLGDVSKAEQTLSHTAPDIAAASIVPVMLGLFLATVSLPLTGILVASLVLGALILMAARRIIRILGAAHIKAGTDTSSRILEYADSIKLLKAYDMVGSGFSTMEQAMLRLKKLSFRSEVMAGIPVQLFLLVMDAGYLIILAAGIRLCAAGSLSMADYFTYLILGHYFYGPLKVLGPILVELRYARLSTGRIAEIFREEPPSGVPGQPDPVSNDLEFRSVGFRYGKDKVLDDLSCSLPAGCMTALVGPSGSGKTTMTSLISRFWDNQEGDVFLGGIPLSEIPPEKLYSRMSMVFQDVYLFNDTIEANIRVGRQDSTDEDVRKAARLACCESFIDSLPDGFHTVIGEGGNTLSGGEKQRISIARAILKDAPVIMLDEATASLDPENEADIQEAIENLVRNRTVIVIAHRFQSIRHADSILVLKDGRLAESGTHDELVRRDGLYNSLWQKQQIARGWKMKT